MKTAQFLIIAISFLLSVRVHGQTNNYPVTGNIGFGTGATSYKLDVMASATSGMEDVMRLRVSDAPNDYLSFNNSTGAGGLFIPSIKGFFTADNRPSLFLMGEIASNNDYGNYAVVSFDARSGGSFVSNRNVFLWRNFTNNLMVLGPTGNLGIGTVTPTHKLEVNGSIRSKEVKVDANAWPDYVFAPGYELMDLRTLSDFILTNRHLPDVPSEKKISEEGLNLGEMDAILLKKIEEFSLYIIQQNDEIQKLKKNLLQLNDKLDRIESREELN